MAKRKAARKPARRRTKTIRMTRPEIVLATTPSAITTRSEATLAHARGLLKRILAAKGRRTVENTVLPHNELLRVVSELAMQGELVFNAHVDAAVRDAGNKAYQAAMSFLSELNLNRPLYEAFAALNVRGKDAETRHAVFKILRDFKRAGVNRDEATRARIKALNDEITAVGSRFDRNINEDVRSISVGSKERLAGLPEDFVAAHPPKEDGRIVLTTNYPDAFPVFQYASDPDVRRQLQWEFLNRGYPKNMHVLDELLVKRNALARLVGYESYAAYITEDKMIGSAKAAAEFVEKISKATESRTSKDYGVLVERKRKDAPGATRLDPWDPQYYMERVRAEQFQFDSQEVRPYFQFERVRDGLFAITTKLFGVRYRRVPSPAWHESVETYDVFDGANRIGRFYLDLHPRDGKFGHAAAFPVAIGLRGVQLPQAALLCNFPDPRKTAGPALMEHGDVVTFFHEFGHLLHEIFSGRARYVKTSMGDIEWDFVEAPSQLLEEWARRPEGLALFARHHETGKPIPRELVDRMERAQSVGRGLWARRQIYFAALSLAYYRRDPARLDTTALAKELNRTYYPVPWYEGTHFQCNFGHLNGYSAVYYTYMWSLVIAKDLFGKFLKARSIMDAATAGRYRRTILDPGSAKPAATMVRQYLGRAPRFDAFQAWLNEGTG
jgi:thimet oligopeptidase